MTLENGSTNFRLKAGLRTCTSEVIRRFFKRRGLISKAINPLNLGPRSPPGKLTLGVVPSVELHLIERVFASSLAFEILDHSPIAVSLKSFCRCWDARCDQRLNFFNKPARKHFVRAAVDPSVQFLSPRIESDHSDSRSGLGRGRSLWL